MCIAFFQEDTHEHRPSPSCYWLTSSLLCTHLRPGSPGLHSSCFYYFDAMMSWSELWPDFLQPSGDQTAVKRGLLLREGMGPYGKSPRGALTQLDAPQ